jgi:hypothetical protein
VKRALLLAAAVAATALAMNVASAPARSLNGKCVPDRTAGVQIVDHVALIVYCGHAKLTLKQGTTVTHWTKGMCLKGAGTYNVGFGKYTAILHPIALANSLVLEAPAPHDGTYRRALLTIQKKGKTAKVAGNVKVVLKGNRSRGTFSGKFPSGVKFTGSFTCK